MFKNSCGARLTITVLEISRASKRAERELLGAARFPCSFGADGGRPMNAGSTHTAGPRTGDDGAQRGWRRAQSTQDSTEDMALEMKKRPETCLLTLVMVLENIRSSEPKP